MQVHSFFIKDSPLKNFNHIIVDEKKAIVIDPLDMNWVRETLRRLSIEKAYLFNTHHHNDHISKNEEFLSLPLSEELKLKDGEEFYLSNNSFIKGVSTPGHIDFHMCLLINTNGKYTDFISGDTVFNCGVGNCKNGGNVEDLFQSIKRISRLPEDIVVYPSHDYFQNNLDFAKSIEPNNKELDKIQMRLTTDGYFFTSLAQEKKINPFFRSEQLLADKQFLDMSEKEIFFELRSRRDKW